MGKKGQKWYREMLLHPKWFLLRTKIWERENHSSEQEVLVRTLKGFQSNQMHGHRIFFRSCNNLDSLS